MADFQNEPITLAPGLITTVAPYDAKGRYVSGNNVRFYKGKPQKIGGYTIAAGAAGALVYPARGVHAWSDLSGNPYVAWGTATNLYLLASGTIYDITPSGFAAGLISGQTTYAFGQSSWGGGSWGGARIYFTNQTQPLTWTLYNWGANLVACYRGGPLYQWVATTGPTVPAAVVAGAPSSMLTFWVSEVDRYFIALGAVDSSNTILADGGSPMTVAWCDQENLNTWVTAITNTAGDVRLETGSIIMASVDTQLGRLILTDTAAYIATYAGPPYIFDFVKVGEGHDAPIGPNAIVARNGIAYWLGPHHIYSFNGLVAPYPCDIENTIYANLDATQAFKVYAGTNRQFGEVSFFYPDIRDATGENSRHFSFNEDGFSMGSLACTSWIDANVASNVPISTDPSGTIHFHEVGTDAAGTPLPYSLESGEIELGQGDLLTYIRKLIPAWELCLGTHTVTLESRRYPQEAPVVRTSTVNGTMGKISLRGRGRSHRLNWSASALGTNFRLGNWRAQVKQDGAQG